MRGHRRYPLLAVAVVLLTMTPRTRGELSSGLPDVLRDLLNQLEADRPEPAGAIAKVSGNKVYINLGGDSGITSGDTLDIVRRPGKAADPVTPGRASTPTRDVAGRLKVVAVQEKLSVCELIEGKAEERSSEGSLNAVVFSRDSGRQKVALGAVRVPPDAVVSEQAVRDAMAAVAGAAGWLTLTPPGQATEELSIGVECSPGGCSIELRLEDRQSGRPGRSARGVIRVGLSAADYGFRSALDGNLGIVLKMDPVKKALQTLGRVTEIGDVLVLVRVGSRGESVWVFPDSRMVVASHSPFNSARQATQLSLVWHNVGRAIDSVSADLSAEDVEARLRTSCGYFTEAAGQLQMLHVEMAAATNLKDLVLAWPDAKATWSELLCTGSGFAYAADQVTIDDKPVISNTGEQVSTVSLGRLTFGDHRLAATKGSMLGRRGPMYFRISAFFERPNGRITLSDQVGKNMATRDVYSWALGDLVLPGNPELLRLTTQPSSPGGTAEVVTRPAREREPPERLRERLETARSHLRNKEYDKALMECYAVLREAPASREAADARKLIAQINEAARRNEAQRSRRPLTPGLRR